MAVSKVMKLGQFFAQAQVDQQGSTKTQVCAGVYINVEAQGQPSSVPQVLPTCFIFKDRVSQGPWT